MAKNTSILLGDYFDNFINSQIKNGKYSSASEVIRAALRMFEHEETKKSELIKELQKEFKTFMKFYNVGLGSMVIMLYVRGIIQVLLIDTNKMMNASISGFAGIAHIIFTIGIVYLFLALRKSKSLFVK